MKYLKTKYEKDSAKITTLIVIILVLLVFVVGPSYQDPPEEYGVAVNFGSSNVGSGKIQPTKPIKSEPKAVTEPTEVEEEVETEAAEPESAEKAESEDIVTQETEEAIALKKQKDAEAKAQAEADAKAKAESDAKAKAKAEAERVEREKKEAEERKRKEEQAKKDKLDALIGGIGKSDGEESGGEGNDSEAGDKGQLDGDPYAPSYFGKPGSGSGGSGYGLNGRGRPTNSKIVPECQEEGRVVVEIHVNKSGKVTNAIPGKKGTTGDGCLYQAAKETALSYKWPSDAKAPIKQVGFVVVNFSLSGN
jgi:membrane protein involved in colicin uptake